MSKATPSAGAARDATELDHNVRGYLSSTQRSPQIVRNYFHAEPVRYAAEP